MPRLCGDLHSSLTPSVLKNLFSKSIFTTLSFVRTNPELLAKISGLQYSQIIKIKDTILTKFSSTLRTGDKHYRNVMNHCAILPSGIGSFDKLLGGGFTTGKLYELCGFAGSGKTQICLTIAVNFCISSQLEVLFIDTKNDISGHRLFEIIEKHQVSNVGKIMQKIKVCQIKCAYELLKVLNYFTAKLKTKADEYLGVRLIFIDSLSSLFQKFHNQNECLSLLNNISNLLRFICIEYQMVILLTNYVTSWTSEVVSSETGYEEEDRWKVFQQPALGKFWTHTPNVRVTIKKLDGLNECFIIVLKSLNQPVGKSVKVRICNRGVI